MPKGTLFLIVGPSGAGKETLATQVCQHCPELYLMPRIITRPAVDGEHISVSIEEYASLKRNYGFALFWDAHGSRYGVSRKMEERLASGQSVVLIGSRSIVDEARSKFQPLKVIQLVAKLDVLSKRLRQRARDTEDDIDRRLGRADRSEPRGGDVITIENSGTCEEGLTLMLAALE